ncbi:HAD family hydrolase [Cohnella sp.]|uniref:HAD family hydrolase n=1 Tax=Cohnella sp. TaxID=1883426 RepID=UPI003565DD22
MGILQVNRRRFDVDVVVFDKDGLLFDSQHFWKCLAEARLSWLSRHVGKTGIRDWCEQFGIREEAGKITGADPNGIFALASPQEEIIVTASVLRRHKGGDWGECRREAMSIFEKSDRDFDLINALLPKRGFPDVFNRLRTAGIVYGIATSDDLSRTLTSIGRFARTDDLKFIVTPVDVRRGKPNPDMLELIAEQTDASLNRIAMIGDSFVDVQMAKEAGCIGIGIPDDPVMLEKMRPFADEIVNSLEEISVVNG